MDGKGSVLAGATSLLASWRYQSVGLALGCEGGRVKTVETWLQRRTSHLRAETSATSGGGQRREMKGRAKEDGEERSQLT